MDYEKIGKFIATLRKENKLTQEELSKKLFTSRENISRWENGKNMPTTETLVHLGEIFNVSVNELIAGERRNNSNEEKIEALNKWRELSHETLKDIVSDKGETIEPTVYEDILELADKVYVNNADAKSKVVLTIERAKKLYDDENGLSNPKLNEQVLEANLDAFETIYSELKSSGAGVALCALKSEAISVV